MLNHPAVMIPDHEAFQLASVVRYLPRAAQLERRSQLKLPVHKTSREYAGIAVQIPIKTPD